MKKELLKKIDSKKAVVGILGLGYVGLPLALEFVQAGFKVIGFEKSREKISSVLSGKSYVVDITDIQLKAAYSTGRLLATEDFSRLSGTDAIIVCVPTPLRKSKDPDMSYILDATAEIAKYFKKGQLIVLESTTYPGTTREVILKTLEEKKPDFKVGADFFVAFSPERVDPANPQFNTKNTPKIIGGISSACTEVSAYLYGKVLDKVIPVGNTETAEMVKLLENTFRSVNIGLINEIALMCEKLNVNVWEVVNAAKTKPYGYMAFYPGPGIGGHCIPLDPYYLSWKMKTLNFYSRFIELAGEINSKMPEYVIDRIADILNGRGKCLKASKILILGVAYKKNVSDFRESPALDIIELLHVKGAAVDYHDPFVPSFKDGKLCMKSVGLSGIGKYDLVVIVTDHKDVDYAAVVRKSKVIFDTRNCLGAFRDKKIFTL